ncbi:MAG: serine O-acetyltransferase [Calditrichaeota bacterium]|nr:serine O-acetyltransferase [Calditrichota bacterium]
MGMIHDIRSVFKYDPAAKNVVEIILAYPGLHAIWAHRISHFLWKLRLPVIPRLISHVTRFLTGVEIHPGAKIGKGVFIDHGMGIVIGETAEVGDECLIYQGVTLGGTSLEKGKRHPTLESHVVVGSGAKILGNIRIGHHSRIGSGSVVLKSVPPHSVVVGIPGRTLHETNNFDLKVLDHNKLPDPVSRVIRELVDRVLELEKEVAHLQNTHKESLHKTEKILRELEKPFNNEKPIFENGAGI